MYALKTTHFIARGTKYALSYATLIKVYACMLNFRGSDLKIIFVNSIAITVVATIQALFKDLIEHYEK